MDKVKASLLSPCLGPVTFMEEKQGFEFVFASQSRFGLGRMTGTQVLQVPFKELSTAISFAAFVVLEHTYFLY